MAEKLPSLYSPDPDDQQLISEIKDQYKDLSESLKERRLPFDPKLMALAQGFLAPTQTGSFGESLGYAAKGYSEAALAEDKTARERAALRLQLAQGELSQRQATRGSQMVNQLFSGDTIEVGGQKFPAGFSKITPELAAKVASQYPDKGELLYKFLKAKDDQLKVQAGGYWDTSKSPPVWNATPGESMVTRNIIWPDGKKAGAVDFTKAEATTLDAAKSAKDWKTYWEIVNRATTPLPSGDAPSTVIGLTPAGQTPPQDGTQITPPSSAGAPAVSPAPITKGDIEAEAARKKQLIEKSAAASVDETTKYKKTGNAALGLLPLFDRAEAILKANPKLRSALGVLEKPDFLSAIGSIVDEGIRVGATSISIPSVRKVATQFSTDEKTLEDLAQLFQIEAQWQFMQREGLGSGTSVSNFEQSMVNQMGPNAKDPYDAYLKKLAFMKEKANFDRAIARRLKGTTQFEDFEATQEFDDLFSAYRKRISSIVYPPSAPNKNAPPSAGGSPSSGSADKRTELDKVREAIEKSKQKPRQ
jgi:hypothetical protein